MMRLSDALALLAAHWRVPYTQLESYQRSLVKAEVIPRGAAGRGVDHVDAETLARFVIAYCSAGEPSKAPAAFNSMVAAKWHSASVHAADVPAAARAGGIVECLSALMADCTNLKRFKIDYSNRIAEVLWDLGPKGDALSCCRDTSWHVGEYDTDFEHSRSFGPATVKLLGSIVRDAQG